MTETKENKEIFSREQGNKQKFNRQQGNTYPPQRPSKVKIVSQGTLDVLSSHSNVPGHSGLKSLL